MSAKLNLAGGSSDVDDGTDLEEGQALITKAHVKKMAMRPKMASI